MLAGRQRRECGLDGVPVAGCGLLGQGRGGGERVAPFLLGGDSDTQTVEVGVRLGLGVGQVGEGGGHGCALLSGQAGLPGRGAVGQASAVVHEKRQ